MRCPAYERHLRAALGQLSEAETRALERHSATCFSCRYTTRELRQLFQDLAAPVALASSEDDFTAAVMRACREAAPARSRGLIAAATSWLEVRHIALALASAALLAGLVRWGAGAERGAERMQQALSAPQPARTAPCPSCAKEPGAGPALVSPRRPSAPTAVPPPLPWASARLGVNGAGEGDADALYGSLSPASAGQEHADDLTTALRLDEQAEAHAARREYVRAQQLCERSLSIKLRALGPSHPDVAAQWQAFKILLALTTQA